MHRHFHLSAFAALLTTASVAAAQDTGRPFDSVSDGGDPGASFRAPAEGTAQQAPAQFIEAPLAGPDEATGADSGAADIVIGAVNIRSASDIPAASLTSSYQKFIGETASRENLQALASSISDAARQQGYIFASAQIPEQTVSMGVVTVELDGGSIDEVRITGSDNRRLRTILNALVGSTARAPVLERQLLLASDLPGIQIEKREYIRKNGAGILAVKVREDRLSGSVAVDNYGPATLGPVRARAQIEYAGVLLDDDVVSARIINTVAQPGELTFFSLRYARTLGDGGTVIGLAGSAGRTRSGADLREFGFQGSNRYAAAFVSYALARSRKFNLWLNGEVAYLNVEQRREDVLYRDDEIVTASVNFTGNYQTGIGRIYAGIGVTQGLGVLGASKAGDPLNSRSDASGTFTKANVWFNSNLAFGSGFGARIAANGQLASDPLLAPHEIAVGGPYFGRGYDFSERYGDEGILGLAELHKEFRDLSSALDWLQLYGFVDGGYVTDIGAGSGPGSGTGFGSGALASAGGGVRANVGRFNLDLQTAAPIDDDRFESQDRSAKVTFQIGADF